MLELHFKVPLAKSKTAKLVSLEYCTLYSQLPDFTDISLWVQYFAFVVTSLKLY
jgi:hypothetical protein